MIRTHGTSGSNSGVTVNFCVAGFRPGSRATFVSAKVAKTILAMLWPFGFPAWFADPGVAQTRKAQTMRAFSPESAALLGHITRSGEAAEMRRFFFELSNLLLNAMTIQTLEAPQDPDSFFEENY